VPDATVPLEAFPASPVLKSVIEVLDTLAAILNCPNPKTKTLSPTDNQGAERIDTPATDAK
jgi:hypothetical protein